MLFYRCNEIIEHHGAIIAKIIDRGRFFWLLDNPFNSAHNAAYDVLDEREITLHFAIVKNADRFAFENC